MAAPDDEHPKADKAPEPRGPPRTRELRSKSTPARERAKERVGEVLAGRYKLRELIGGGGMGWVYRARHLGLRRDVAVKVVQSDLARDEAFVRALQREAETTANIKSDHIVTITDFDRHDDEPFYVMEVVDGDLDGYVQNLGALNYSEIYAIVEQIAEAAAAAHGANIVHRDLKPGNVLVEDRDEEGPFVKIIDFGVAKALGVATSTIDHTGSARATARYLAPEMLRGDPVAPHPGMDVFAIGLIAYELTLGRHPWEDRSPAEISLIHQSDRPLPSLDTTEEGRAAGVTPGFAAVVARACAYEHEERYPDAKALLKALRSCDDMDPANLARGTLVADRYRVEERLGGGGMGAVYRVIDERSKDQQPRRALKLFAPPAGLRPERYQELVERFRNECGALIGVNHPNLVRIHNAGDLEGVPYAVLDLVEGPTFEEVEFADWGTFARAVREIASAVDVLHKANIIHRDLKPSNMMWAGEGDGGDGHAILIDLGVARFEGSELTHTGILLGTEGFLAPEQRAIPSVAVPASDQWALAASVYWMLTKRMPSQGEEAPITPIDELCPDIAPTAAAAIMRALSLRPEDRFSTLEELAAALGSEAGNVASPAAATQQAGPPALRWRYAAGAAAVAAVAVVGLVLLRDSTPVEGPPATVATVPGDATATDTVVPAPDAPGPSDDAALVHRKLTITTTMRGKVRTGVELTIGDKARESPVTIEVEPGAALDVLVTDRRYKRERTICPRDAEAPARCEVRLRRRARAGEPKAEPKKEWRPLMDVRPTRRDGGS